MTDITRAQKATEFAARFLSGAPQLHNPLSVLASPAWRGIEGDVWRAADGTESIILKHYHADTAFYVSPEAAINATTEAGRIGVGPKVLGADQKAGLLAMSDLRAPWEAGGLHHATNPAIRKAVIAQKKKFQQEATLTRSANIFDEIEELFALAVKADVATHRDIDVFINFSRAAARKIASLGANTAPCHRDGNTANLMVHADTSVQLIDFDLAANCDPFEDLGVYLREFFDLEPEARLGFEEWYGTFDEGLFQRAMIYGITDDLRWGLIGSILGAQSARRDLEFTKYAAWRFLRLETDAKGAGANDRIRTAT